MNKKYFLALSVLLLSACSSTETYTQKSSPNNAYKDYKGFDKSVIGVGKTITERKSEANATISFRNKHSLNKAIEKFAYKYHLSVEWDSGVDKYKEETLLLNEQTFNEARSYLEDIYDVSIIRLRDRSIKIHPSSSQKVLETFNPGPNVVLADAVTGLAELCSVNLVIADYKSVLRQERITTNLSNISCDQAFEAILSPVGLSLKHNGNHYAISGLPYREWSLNLHEQKREENNEINYSSEFSANSDSGGNSVSGGSASTSTSYSRDLWDSLEKDLKELVKQACQNNQNMGYSPSENITTTETFSDGSLDPVITPTTGSARNVSCGYVRVNPDVGIVQMQAPRRVLNKGGDIIARVEDIASRRLLVEARILAVSKTRDYQRGADINVSGNAGSTDFTLGFNPDTVLKDGSSVAGTLTNLLNNGSETLSGGGLAFGAGDLDAVVRYVESFGTTYQLMKPTLEVMDRQRATLIDGRNERYFIRTASVDNSGDTPIVTTEAEEKVQFVGIQFSVSAQVADEGELHTVALQIPITEISKYVELDNQIGVDANDNPITMTDSIPVSTTKVIDQKVRLRDNDVKVIGGITRRIAVDKETGIPILQEIPVAGKAFSEESISYENVEFVVLLQVKRLY